MASAAAAMLRGSHDGNDPFISTSNYPNHGKTNCSNKLETDKKKDLGKRTEVFFLHHFYFLSSRSSLVLYYIYFAYIEYMSMKSYMPYLQYKNSMSSI